MDYQKILSQLKKRQFAPIYFLHGSEPYFIDIISDYIENHVLTDAEKSFNQSIFYGKEIKDAKTLIDTAYRYPMMASHQVVIVKEAQEMRSLKDVRPYIEKPVPTTILVFCHKHKSFNTNTKLGKALKKNAVVLKTKKLYDNQVPDWISAYLKEKKYKVRPDAAELMAEYLGVNLSTVANELDKLMINLPPSTTVTTDHVEENIGISKEYNIFELQKALGQKDELKVARIVNNFTANPKKNPLILVIGTLYNYFSKVYMYHFVKNQSEKEILKALSLRSSWFLKEYKMAARNYNKPRMEAVIGILREYDLKSKGVDFNTVRTKDGELLKEMIWRIMKL